MQDCDKQKFFELLVGTAEMVRADISKHGQKLYWAALKDYSIEDIERAFMLHIKNADTGQYMPKPADIIRQIDGDTGSMALVAWGKVRDAIGSVGHTGSVAFDDPVIHSAVQQVGGWEEICTGQEKNLVFVERRFTEAYRVLMKKPDHPRYLPGLHERENRGNGFAGHVQPPALIGDRKKAAALLDSGAVARKLLEDA